MLTTTASPTPETAGFTKTKPTRSVRAVLTATVAATVVVVTGLAGCANNDASSMPGMNHGSSAPAGSGSPATPAATGTPAAGPHNDADVMFATMMMAHHQQAIEMSDMILEKDSIDPAVTELAQQIKDAQTPEITQMQGWLTGWGASASASGMDHGGDDGMMSQADMDALMKANGTEAAKLFLAGMVKHHQGAITMAQEEVTNGQNPEAKKLAQTIITSQQAEIEKMNTMLRSL